MARNSCFKTKIVQRRCLLALLIFSVPWFFTMYLITDCITGCGSRPRRSGGPYKTFFPNREWRNNPIKTILFWTANFGDPWWSQEGKDPFKTCPHKCRFTIDKAEQENADALLFHSRDVWNYFMGISMPSHHPPHQVWIWNSGEPPPHIFLDMKAHNNIFNWTLWYRSSADLRTTTGIMVRRDNESISWQTETDSRLRNAGTSFSNMVQSDVSLYKNKLKSIAWIASNCMDHGRRQRIVQQLQEHLQIDTYGDCGDKKLSNCGWVCSDVLSSYRFYLSFENSVCQDYVSEKFWLPLTRGQIPIVYGGANYSYFVPRNSYIHVNDFEDIKSLAQYIKMVSTNESLYNSFMWWKKYYKIINSPPPWCMICEALNDRSRPAQVYSDMEGWFHDDICPQFSVTNIVSRFVEGLLLKYRIIS